MSERQAFNAPKILDHEGRPLRTPLTDACPQCGEGKDKRVPSGGFGVVHPLCICGYVWENEVWRG